MNDLSVLEILLHGQRIGTISNIPGDRNVLSFDDAYINNTQRPTLSLSLKDSHGDLITHSPSTRTRLHPFFSNLLPEGYMRDYLAHMMGTNTQREFFLLQALGKDLAGAVTTRRVGTHSANQAKTEEDRQINSTADMPLRFSLAGVQLKFSALEAADGGLTIPAFGIGGSWILKLPSLSFNGVPENEYALMRLAKAMGMDVPEVRLVELDTVEGLPQNLPHLKGRALLVKRFDRAASGKAIHIEDFAQVFSVFPEAKYKSASYRNISDVLAAEVGTTAIIEFLRRVIFSILIGNGDMHLKNWSLIYPDKRTAQLAPAYDFLSTLPYIPDDKLALSFAGTKAFQAIDEQRLIRFASHAKLPTALVIDTTHATVQQFKDLWPSVDLDTSVRATIQEHLDTLAIYR